MRSGSQSQVLEYLADLADECALYGVDRLRAIPGLVIVLGVDLSHDGTEVDGATVIKDNALLLSLGLDNALMRRLAFHHELYHLLESMARQHTDMRDLESWFDRADCAPALLSIAGGRGRSWEAERRAGLFASGVVHPAMRIGSGGRLGFQMALLTRMVDRFGLNMGPDWWSSLDDGNGMVTEQWVGRSGYVRCPGTDLDEVRSTGANQALERLGAALDIACLAASMSFAVESSHGEIAGRAVSPSALERYVTVCVPEITLYPVELVDWLGLRCIVICEGLSYAGEPRAAVPDLERRALFLDANRNWPTHYVRSVVHHELFHMIDYVDDGVLYDDGSWSSLNVSTFKYGRKPGVEGAPGYGDVPGFLSEYSMSSVEEDKAEVFALLMVDHEQVSRRALVDGVLSRKVGLLKARLYRSCPRIDHEFWRVVAASRRN
jgi:hypothetical protein